MWGIGREPFSPVVCAPSVEKSKKVEKHRLVKKHVEKREKLAVSPPIFWLCLWRKRGF